MTDVLTVASYIEETLKLPRYDTKKLQKLVYFAQAWSLAWTGKKIFPNQFEAWPDGPVVRELFRMQKHYELPAYDGSLPLAQREIIDSVLAYYGQLGHQDLIDLTHEHTPWLEARGSLAPTAPSQAHLNDGTLRSFYTQRAICDPDGPTRQTSLFVLTDDSADAIGDVVSAEWEETLSLLANA
ncbi:type II toxin-antitoxin system antitoxin SocA domain-containing protein [Curtobacterium sp. DN_7.5]|uniref:Panacea domain-containing protein n=1 Tax=Curtobacterium sp. DN_7.5 TaxID=3049047 RepID=UPI001F5922DB|nr:type II toxin-antitoxin system antitoxin SocA domain-containing protein [Curtobacterium sp. DN_7.5]